MVDNGHVPFISPASKNGSSEQNTRSFIAHLGGSSILGGSTKGGEEYMMIGLPEHTATNNNKIPTPPSQPQPPPTSEYLTLPEEKLNTPPSSKRARGRPPGSKNKPKSLIIISEEYDNIPKPIVIEIPPGNDVIASLINFARHRQVNLTVLSASGIVSDILIRNPLIRNGPDLTYRGLHGIISLKGTYTNFPFPCSSSIANGAACKKNFVISLSGSQGAVYGGFVAGKVMAASRVVVMATTFNNFEYHKVAYINGNMLVEEGEEQHSSGSNSTVASKNNV